MASEIYFISFISVGPNTGQHNRKTIVCAAPSDVRALSLSLSEWALCVHVRAGNNYFYTDICIYICSLEILDKPKGHKSPDQTILIIMGLVLNWLGWQ